MAESQLLRTAAPAAHAAAVELVAVPTPGGAVQARRHRLAEGGWDPAADRVVAERPPLGLLVLDGVILCEARLGGRWSATLLGAGDLLRPWDWEDDAVAPVPMRTRCTVLAGVTIAVLDDEFLDEIKVRPGAVAHFIKLACDQTQRLRRAVATDHLSRVEVRVLALFWHLADRWGHVTSDGVSIPLRLRHETLGRLVGARRPTISTACGLLDEHGLLRRRPDGTWLLTSAALSADDPLSAQPGERRR